MLLDFAGSYRTQSSAIAQPAALRGRITDRCGSLSAAAVNRYLARQSQWSGRAKVDLRIIEVETRNGAFAVNDDALYYRRNFVGDATGPPCDLLDIGKLGMLRRRRLAKLLEIFTPAAGDGLCAALQSADAAADEYICHEAGHRIGFSIEEKIAEGFFRRRGRLCWPLIYMEEYRADVCSWPAAIALLPSNKAARVILFTLVHRLGLAIENLREGVPGAGFIPYLHFAAFHEAGLLKPEQISADGTVRVHASTDPEAVLAAAKGIFAAFDSTVGAADASRDIDIAAEAFLSYASDRLGDSTSAVLFADLLTGVRNSASPAAAKGPAEPASDRSATG